MSQPISVQFHVLEQAGKAQALLYACQQIEKLYQNKVPLYVHTESETDAKYFDTLLWTFREDSFVPHHLHQAQTASSSPVQIGYKNNTCKHGTTLINLSQHVPDHYQHFSNIVEIVFADPALQQLARDRFKQYRDQGCTIQTNKLTSL
jgi:DNA polymerase-3 subunit chi